MSKEKSVAIIGGGAAGLMAAASLVEYAPGLRVTLFEKNPKLGVKVAISGGGRCNVTTGIFDVRELLKNYPRGAKFLMTAMYHFPPEKVMSWFESHDVPLKIEEDLRVFPRSNQGWDIVRALEDYLKKGGVEIQIKANVLAVKKSEKGEYELTVQDGATKEIESKIFSRVVIATGGNAYRHTGSTGDGYAFASSLGHSITPLAPSLNSYLLLEPWVADIAGVSFEKVTLSIGSHVRTGACVFTHKGISGPAVFALSALTAYEPCDRSQPLSVSINFFPDETSETLGKKIEEVIAKNAKKMIVNIVDIFLPKSLCKIFVDILGVDSQKKGAEISKDLRVKVVELLQKFPLTAVGRSAGEEFVSAGGVALSEVNTNTMESKICPGLYFAGEILDVDGFTGGFNLQASWAAGRLAGESISGELQ